PRAPVQSLALLVAGARSEGRSEASPTAHIRPGHVQTLRCEALQRGHRSGAVHRWLSCPVREETGDRARSSTSSAALPDFPDPARTRPRRAVRIWTSPDFGRPADLGASWIHGFEDNPIARFARRQGSPGRNPPVVQRRRATIHAADDDHSLVGRWLVTSI